MKIVYDSYKHAKALEDFSKFLKKDGIKPYPALLDKIKMLKEAKQVIVKGK